MHLQQSICVVTGAARGIGRALAEQLLAEGACVILSDVDAVALQQTVAEFDTPRAVAAVADVSSAEAVAALVAVAEAAFGRIDVWINNAGLARHRAIVDYTESEIDLMLDVNLKGTILGSQAALRSMAPRQSGHIINIISTASLRGVPTETVYCAAKWGARGFTQGIREEAAPHSVRVTGLLPGGVDTDFWKDATAEREVPVQRFLTTKQVIALIQMDDSVVPQELVLRAMGDRDFGS